MGSLDYRALAVLDAVASHGSFEKAAVALGISQSAVSQRIKALEDASGRLLIIRGQPAVPTGLGQRLITHHRHVKLMEASLDIDLGNTVSMPELAIAIDDDSLATWFPAALAPLLAPPRCQLDVRLADSDTALQMVRDGTVFGCVASDTGTDGHRRQRDAAGHLAPCLRGHARVCRPLVRRRFQRRSGAAGAGRGGPAQPAGALPGRATGPARAVSPSPPAGWQAARRACIEDGLAYGLMPQRLAAPYLATDRLVDLAARPHAGRAAALACLEPRHAVYQLLSEQIVRSARAWLS